MRFFFDDAIAQGDKQLVMLARSQVEADHGRVETRRLWVSGQVAWLRQQGHDWAGLRGIVWVECQREVSGPGGKTTTARRYFLTSHDPCKVGAGRLLAMVRGHRSVEQSPRRPLVFGCEP